MKKFFLIVISTAIFIAFNVNAEVIPTDAGESSVLSSITVSDEAKDTEKRLREREKIQKRRIERIKASEMILNEGDKPTLREHVIDTSSTEKIENKSVLKNSTIPSVEVIK